MRLSELTASAEPKVPVAAPKRLKLSFIMNQPPESGESDFQPTKWVHEEKPINIRIEGPKNTPFETILFDDEELKFKEWKSVHAPDDSGADYDLRGAFKAGFKPDQNKHFPDTFKKPNHPTFSDESIYAVGEYASKAGRWEGDRFIRPTEIRQAPEKTLLDRFKGLYKPSLTKQRMIDELSKDFDLNPKEVSRNFDHFARKKAQAAGFNTQPTNDEMLTGIMTATLPMTAAITGPMLILKGVVGFTAVKEGSERVLLPVGKALWQALNSEPVKYEVTKLREVFPDVGPLRKVADLAEFVIYGRGAKSLIGSSKGAGTGLTGSFRKMGITEPRIMGEIAGIRFRLLKAMGVTKESTFQKFGSSQETAL